MKKLLILVTAAVGLSASAENLTAGDGTVYRNVVIVSADPEEMLIVHDGGGCQVRYDDLVPGSLSEPQRRKVEKELMYYAERQARLEKARAERELFEAAQREKGLIEFEGAWMTPLDKEALLLKREERRLEIEKQRLQLARERAQLEKEKYETERARYLLEGENRDSSYFYYGTYSSVTRGGSGPYRNSRCPSKPRSRQSSSAPRIFTSEEQNPYISTEGAALYNRGPFNRY